ncbi:MAG: hypothetical protein AABY22_04675 [Nanoarchaeota archaeon]
MEIESDGINTDILCDSCGKSCKKEEFVIDNNLRSDHGQKEYIFEYMLMTANWGYWSGKDTEQWTAHICEKCIDGKFGFVKFKKHDYFINKPIN